MTHSSLPLIVDAHLDLAYSALHYGRNLAQPVDQIRQREGKRPPNGIATVAIPDLLQTGVAVVFGTLFVLPAINPLGYESTETVYRTPAEAHRQAMAQLDYYHQLADEDERVRLTGDVAALQSVTAAHGSDGRTQGLRTA